MKLGTSLQRVLQYFPSLKASHIFINIAIDRAYPTSPPTIHYVKSEVAIPLRIPVCSALEGKEHTGTQQTEYSSIQTGAISFLVLRQFFQIKQLEAIIAYPNPREIQPQ